MQRPSGAAACGSGRLPGSWWSPSATSWWTPVAGARESGANAVRVGPVTDDRAVLREVLADQLVRADLLVLAGGLSAGPWDTVADVLGPLGTVRLDGVSLSPGGRQGLGTVRGMTLGETDDVGEDDRPGALVVALPGHPVAALLSFEMFVRPAVRKMAGYTELFRPSVRATAARRWPGRTAGTAPCSPPSCAPRAGRTSRTRAAPRPGDRAAPPPARPDGRPRRRRRSPQGSCRERCRAPDDPQGSSTHRPAGRCPGGRGRRRRCPRARRSARRPAPAGPRAPAGRPGHRRPCRAPRGAGRPGRRSLLT